jgi:hypothetical protein
VQTAISRNPCRHKRKEQRGRIPHGIYFAKFSENFSKVKGAEVRGELK